MAASRVLIVNMPFSNLRWPNLGPSLLKAALVRRGIGCDVAYLNFDFAERVGLGHYDWIADYFAFVLGGERLFAKDYFAAAEKGTGPFCLKGPEGAPHKMDLSPFLQLPDDESYFRDVLLAADAELTAEDLADYQATEEHVAPFLDACMAAIDWPRYAIAGFATTFQQTMPSMCLARRIKQIRPDMKIVFGGAGCEGPMGVELARLFQEIDYVFLGEADLTFPPVVEQILGGKPVHLPPGVVGREEVEGRVARPERSDGRGDSRIPPATPFVPQGVPPEPEAYMVHNLDELPYPDFDDYFARLKSSPLAAEIDPLLFYETSRGCWWGQKHHCAFCGLNGASLAYRGKDPRRAVDELRWLVRRYGVRRACSADNIFDYRYFDTFLPMLREAKLGLGFEYELKTNLTRQQVQKLLDAGLGAAQLGIETFITPVLKLIGKGASAVQNLQVLKWFSEAGIEVKWNFLYGFPGEDPADYAELLALLPSLVHLASPLATGRVRLDRFSPYFGDPERWGMANPRPNRAFRHVYPFPEESLARMAYYFEYDYADGRNPLDYVAPVLEAFRTWRDLQGTVTLRYWDRPDGVLILNDTRPCAAAFQRRLTGLARQVYLYCDTGRTLEKIVEMAAQSDEPGPTGAAAVRRMLDEWVAARIMALLDNRYLSLALRVRSDVDPS
jgi:radical SAM superfamily enzyme YgiQ (UPF0313 family)